MMLDDEDYEEELSVLRRRKPRKRRRQLRMTPCSSCGAEIPEGEQCLFCTPTTRPPAYPDDDLLRELRSR